MTAETIRGIVLRLASYGEADRMASVLCADGSRREVRVPQARASRARFGGFELYVIADHRFAPDRRGRPRLEEVEIVQSHRAIRDDLVRSALSAHVVELVAQVAQEEHPHPDLYRLTEAALAAIAGGSGDGEPSGFARAVELKLLHVLGVRPALTRCAATGEALTGSLRWSTSHGGALGPSGPVDAHALPIDRTTLAQLDAALRRPLVEQNAVPWTSGARAQAERALADFLASHVGTRTRARRFLHDVLAGLAAVLVATVGIGCGPTELPSAVRVQGWLYESPAPTADALAIPAAPANAWSLDGELVAQGSEPFSDAPGWYRFSELLPGTVHHHVFEPPIGEDTQPEELGHVTTVVLGASGLDDLYVDAGGFHLWPRPTVEGWRTVWALGGVELAALDPGAEEGGGLVRGAVRDPGGSVGRALRLVSEGVTIEARYVGQDGAPDPQAAALSGDGGFVFAQVPVGLWSLEALEPDGEVLDGALTVRIVEDGVTSLPGLLLGP